jgi:hypothetical protein
MEADMALLSREEAAIQAAWVFFCRNRDAMDIPFAAVVMMVQARCPGVDPARVRAGFEKRFGRRSIRP